MLVKGCPVQACSSHKPGASHPALGPLGADPPGLSLGSAGIPQTGFALAATATAIARRQLIPALQCDQVHCPCSSQHACTNLAPLMCRAIKHLSKHSFERVILRLERVLLVVDDDHVKPQSTEDNDGTQHADMTAIAALCCLLHAVFAVLSQMATIKRL